MSDAGKAFIIESSQDLSYLEYDEDLVEDIRDEYVLDSNWAINGKQVESDNSRDEIDND